MLASGLRTEPTPSEKPCGYGEQEASGAVEHDPAEIGGHGPVFEPSHQAAVARTCAAASGGHLNKGAIGSELEHRLRVGRTHLRELGRGEAERGGQGEHEGPARWVSSG